MTPRDVQGTAVDRCLSPARSILSQRLQLRISLVASIYDKILRLPSVGGTGPATLLTSGHVTNLASNDVERFLSTAVTSNFIVLGPIEALVILGIGISIIGPVFCAGYALLCLLVPFQFWLSHRFASFRSRIAKETDARVGWISQAVHGARIMKQSGFEDLFLEKITQQRSAEIRQLQTSARLKALNEAIYFVSSVVVAVVVFSVHVFALGGTLTPQTVYTTLSLLNILQFTLTKHIPNAIMGLSECCISCNRLQAFLDLPETEKTADHKSNEPQALSMTNVTCYWDSDLLDPSHRPSEVALSNINLKCQSGKLYCVIGKIGSSKSALLQAVSGELPSAEGTIKQQYRRIGYAAQEPWIMDGTIRENILLGLDLDQEWYDRVIDACALRHDLAQFSQGDGTIVGDRGVQCSGGQKARIGLARVFYKRDNQLLLLDDPLSAVDAKVAKTIFFSAIQRLGVQRGLCIILVTHQHQFVGMADECILMDQGKITTTGTFADCMAASPDSIREVVTMQAETEEDRAVSEEHVAQIPDPKDKQNEKRVTGIVKLDIWTSYAKAFGGFPTCAAFLAIFVATQGTLLVTIVFLGKWGDAASVDQQSSKWFGIIGGTTAGLVTLSILRAQLSFAILIRCSRKLHDQMARAVLRANICFFDTNPLGRILNRFSADVGIVDEALPCKSYSPSGPRQVFLPTSRLTLSLSTPSDRIRLPCGCVHVSRKCGNGNGSPSVYFARTSTVGLVLRTVPICICGDNTRTQETRGFGAESNVRNAQ
jgi:ATP-binding cassette subfamily C (CFTR/MRP) protein 4